MNVNRLVKHIGLWGLSAVAMALAAPSAHAQSAASTFQVTAAVARTCSISTVPMNFGNYDPVVTHATTPLDINGSVTITCTRGTLARIDLNAGLNSANATAPETRAMSTGGASPEYLSYDLYRDGPGVTIWGTGIGNGALSPPGAPDRNPRTYTIYGRIPAGQDKTVGNYSDTVTATVNF